MRARGRSSTEEKTVLMMEAAEIVVGEMGKKQAGARGRRRGVETAGGRGTSKVWDGIGTEQGALSNKVKSTGKVFLKSETPASAADK